MVDVVEYSKLKFGFKPTKTDIWDIANEFCDWCRKTRHEDLIVDLSREIGR